MGLFTPTDPEQRQENDMRDLVVEVRKTNELLAELLELTKRQAEAAGVPPAQAAGPLGAFRV